MAKVPRQEFRFKDQQQKNDLKTLMKIREEKYLNTMISKAVDSFIEHNREAIEHYRETKRLQREAKKLENI